MENINGEQMDIETMKKLNSMYNAKVESKNKAEIKLCKIEDPDCESCQ